MVLLRALRYLHEEPAPPWQSSLAPIMALPLATSITSQQGSSLDRDISETACNDFSLSCLNPKPPGLSRVCCHPEPKESGSQPFLGNVWRRTGLLPSIPLALSSAGAWLQADQGTCAPRCYIIFMIIIAITTLILIVLLL